jgi:hypothetical protein
VAERGERSETYDRRAVGKRTWIGRTGQEKDTAREGAKKREGR